ncbi:hypothetical protein [Nocardia wallacei]|uniref:hypothetical protein n=1 Tax=Nocardia wallacei TaxID=480035 RepID=UPI002454DE30|nr:hypothetical protein [Nocardia wallacei]
MSRADWDDWEGATMHDGSAALVTYAGGAVGVSLHDADGREVIVWLDAERARIFAEHFGEAADDAAADAADAALLTGHTAQLNSDDSREAPR